ncbi:DUF4041 domain-containing protein [Blastopirellula sp. J2-11]|uniref:DUF4041 domain-containing protein n=1 Tax=Blastopirellula sp. J2-11 TaxID=2943192 RepID=UPI0021C7E7C9|nr:DUF4041 domain-containing protein [Blastopirellula sp. J2-11]UUO06503.1 DUF4041 domain-containing protein [Blastopirellula sp. J2-11]
MAILFLGLFILAMFGCAGLFFYAQQIVEKNHSLEDRIDVLKKYEPIVNVERECQRIHSDAVEYARTTVQAANSEVAVFRAEIEQAKIVAAHYQQTAAAMQNVIEGYGAQYLASPHELLDDLATHYDHTSAGAELKKARTISKEIIRTGRAATSNVGDPNVRKSAIDFVTEVFVGKTDAILSKVKSDNYGILVQKLADSFTLVNHTGANFGNTFITPEFYEAKRQELQWAVAVQEFRQQEKEEQRQIREQMREEERARREFERAIREAEDEERRLKQAMEQAKRELESASIEQRSVYEARLAELETKLADAEAKGERAISMAQQTKQGNVYVISNIGSFGEDVFKVGLTRRLEPMERVKELGDASVPFSFDVHAMIPSENAPALEAELHRRFAAYQVNKINFRKEFFRIKIEQIKEVAEEMGYKVHWTMKASAEEYYESQNIENQSAVEDVMTM